MLKKEKNDFYSLKFLKYIVMSEITFNFTLLTFN